MNSSFSVEDDASSMYDDEIGEGKLVGDTADPVASSSSVVLVLPGEGLGLNQNIGGKSSRDLSSYVVGGVPLYIGEGEEGKSMYYRQFSQGGFEVKGSPNYCSDDSSFGGFSNSDSSNFEGFGPEMFEGFIDDDTYDSDFDGFSEDSEFLEGKQKIEYIKRWQKNARPTYYEDSDDSDDGLDPVDSFPLQKGSATNAKGNRKPKHSQPHDKLISQSGRPKSGFDGSRSIKKRNVITEGNEKSKLKKEREVKCYNNLDSDNIIDPAKSSFSVHPTTSWEKCSKSTEKMKPSRNSESAKMQQSEKRKSTPILSSTVGHPQKKAKMETHLGKVKPNQEKRTGKTETLLKERPKNDKPQPSVAREVSTKKRSGTELLYLVPTEDEVEVKQENLEQADEDYIGPYCNQVGCTISWLESLTVKVVTVTNGMVFELDEFAKKINWEKIHVAKWILRLRGILDTEPTDDDLSKIHTILKRRKALTVTMSLKKRCTNSLLLEFDETQFVLPSEIQKDVQGERVSDYSEKDRKTEEKLLKENKSYQSKKMRSRSVASISDSTDQFPEKSKLDLKRIGARRRKSAPAEESSQHISSKKVDTKRKSLGDSSETQEKLGRKVLGYLEKPDISDMVAIKKKKSEDPRVSYHCVADHVYPHFNETDVSIGKYCNDVGLMVNDLNTRGKKDFFVSQGVVCELHAFYRQRGCTITALAQKLMEFKGLPNISLVSMNSKICLLLKKSDNSKKFMEAEFQYPLPRKDGKAPLCKFKAPGWECKVKMRTSSPNVSSNSFALEMDDVSKIDSKVTGEIKETKTVLKKDGNAVERDNNEEKQVDSGQTVNKIVEFVEEEKDLKAVSAKHLTERIRESIASDDLNCDIKKNLLEEGYSKLVSKKLDPGEGKCVIAEKKSKEEINKERDKENRLYEGESRLQSNIEQDVVKELEVKSQGVPDKEVVENQEVGINESHKISKEVKFQDVAKTTVSHELTSEEEESQDAEKELESQDIWKEKITEMRDVWKGKVTEMRDASEKDDTASQDGSNEDKKVEEQGTLKKVESVEKVLLDNVSKFEKVVKHEDDGSTGGDELCMNTSFTVGSEVTLKCDAGNESVISDDDDPGLVIDDRDSDSSSVCGEDSSEVPRCSDEEKKVFEETKEDNQTSLKELRKADSHDFLRSDAFHNLPGPQNDKGFKACDDDITADIRKSERERFPTERVKEFHSMSEFHGQESSMPQESKESPKKTSRKYISSQVSRFLKREDPRVSFSFVDGRIIPFFKDSNMYLGEHCEAIGITIDDLNSDKEKDVIFTKGAISELVKFYQSLDCTMTSLADRLLKMKKLYLPSILNLVAKFSGISKLENKRKLAEVFRFPPGEYNVDKRTPNRRNPKTKNKTLSSTLNPAYCCEVVFNEGVKRKKKKKIKADGGELLSPKKKKKDGGRERKKKLKNTGTPSSQGGLVMKTSGNHCTVDREVENLRGKEGSVTRADIVLLYAKWLNDKNKTESTVFVTDLLRGVMDLMEERKVPRIRIPAGTLMSSSVKLYEEYKRMWNTSKADAMMYLEEDWLEDIQYLVSLTVASKRAATEASEGNEYENKRSQGDNMYFSDASSEKSLRIDESYPSDFSDSEKVDVDKPKNRSGPKISSDLWKKNKTKSPKKIVDSPKKNMILKDENTLSNLVVSPHKNQKMVDPFVKNVPQMTDNIVTSVKKYYEIDKIVDYKCKISKRKRKYLSYLVRWKGLGPEHDTWLEESILQCPESLKELWNGKTLASKTPEAEKTSNSSITNETEVSDKENSPDNLCYYKCKAEKNYMTNGELLNLYDCWREENHKTSKRKVSSSINVTPLAEKVEKALESYGIEAIYSDYLLQACFTLTLTRKMLSSEEALQEFLSKDCIPALESSRISQENNQRVGGNVKIGVLSANYVKLKTGFVETKTQRADKQLQVAVVEEEVNMLGRTHDRACGKLGQLGEALRQEMAHLGKSLIKLNEGGRTQWTQQFQAEYPEEYEQAYQDIKDCGVKENDVESVMASVLKVIDRTSEDPRVDFVDK